MATGLGMRTFGAMGRFGVNSGASTSGAEVIRDIIVAVRLVGVVGVESSMLGSLYRFIPWNSWGGLDATAGSCEGVTAGLDF